MKGIRLRIGTAALVVAALSVLGLAGGVAARSSTTRPTVATATTSLGKILVDGRGRTLYLFEKDQRGKSACNGQCATLWPPLVTSAKPSAGRGAKAALLGTTKRADGRLQVTYSRHPLYRYVKDVRRGQTKGEGIDAFGAEWYAVSPLGKKVEKESSTSGNGGYGGGGGYGGSGGYGDGG